MYVSAHARGRTQRGCVDSCAGRLSVRATLNYPRCLPSRQCTQRPGKAEEHSPTRSVSVRACDWPARLCAHAPPRGTPTQQLTHGRWTRKIGTPRRRAPRVVLDPCRLCAARSGPCVARTNPRVRPRVWSVWCVCKKECVRLYVVCVRTIKCIFGVCVYGVECARVVG